MSKKLGQYPAFPIMHQGIAGSTYYSGMSQRLYLAGMFVQGIVSNPDEALVRRSKGYIAALALEFAEELLKQEDKLLKAEQEET